MKSKKKVYPKLVKRVSDVWLFPNANLVCCDSNGEQIGELQGAFSVDRLKRIMLERNAHCVFDGFSIIPDSWFQECRDWAEYFIEREISFDEINEL